MSRLLLVVLLTCVLAIPARAFDGKDSFSATACPDEEDSFSALGAELPDTIFSGEETELPDAAFSSAEIGLSARPAGYWYRFEAPEPGYGTRFLKGNIAPLAVGLTGLAVMAADSLKWHIQERLSWNDDWHAELWDDELRYAPVAIGLVLPLFGLNPKHKPLHLIPLVTASYCFADLCNYRLKVACGVERPNPRIQGESKYRSFPSQHASMAFVFATALHREYGQYSPWISVGGYAVAGYVAYCRVAQSYHWLSDVLVGAAMGTICTNMVYLAYDGLSDWITSSVGHDVSLCPFATSGGGGLYLSCAF